MGRVRPLSRDDIPEVGDLFIQVFRPGARPSRERVLEYFEQVYFENPWYDPEIPSLVYDDGVGGLIGFLGVVARPMRLHRRPLRAAIPGSLMVRPGPPERTDPFAPLALVREFLQGQQDLALTDTASEDSRKIWERCGGVTSRLYSFRWLRPIRPFALALDTLRHRGGARAAAALARPLCRIADVAIRRTRIGPFRCAEHGCRVEELRVENAVERFSNLTHHSLVPAYDEATLDWLLRMAASKRGHGKLRSALVRDGSGSVLGWYIYYLKAGATSEVLQIVANPYTIDRVFSCLLEEAVRGGTNALVGRLDPLFMQELSRRHCLIRPAEWVLVHARDARILDPFRTGEALFTGLEGERWMRFMGDSFEDR